MYLSRRRDILKPNNVADIVGIIFSW